MKRTLFILALLSSTFASTQETYTELTEKALQMAASEDSTHTAAALGILEEAFGRYPDSINGTALYYASIFAAELKKTDLAFDYLTTLANMETDEEGYPGWSFVLDEYAQEDYENLLSDQRWNALEQRAQVDKKAYFEKLDELQKDFFSTVTVNLASITDAKELYQTLQKIQPYQPKHQRDYSISFEINDSTHTSYLVHLPENYDPNKQYASLIFLHGAVRYSSLEDYQVFQKVLGGWNRYYTKYAALHDVILVFPSANADYNWMTSDDGFFMVPEIIRQLKTTLNLDDNKVFISGHSNGATGSFSYAMKQPTQFAGFYGFNTQPKVVTGGTFIENILNRSYLNFSTDQDYYYPPNANDSFTKLMDSIHADYKEYRYNGFPHWFPEFDASEPAYQLLFSDLTSRERNPFPKNIVWELDDNNYGAIDWLTEITLDTLTQRADWHTTINFKIDKWLKFKDDESDSLIAVDVNKEAFDFSRKSGKIVAKYDNNVFRISTSCIGSFHVNISPEMVNLNKKVKVYINGKRRFNKRISYNREFMIKSFEKNKDRTQIWVNSIPLKL